MKTQISFKKMIEQAKFTTNQPVFKIGYCEWSCLFRLIDKLDAGIITYKKLPYYSAGIYGWNCDYYQLYLKNRKVIIATGYRCSAKFEQVHYKLVEVVEQKALEMLEKLAGIEKMEKIGADYVVERIRMAKDLESLVNLVL